MDVKNYGSALDSRIRCIPERECAADGWSLLSSEVEDEENAVGRVGDSDSPAGDGSDSVGGGALVEWGGDGASDDSAQSMLLDELYEKNKLLAQGWKKAENRILERQRENERLCGLLVQERDRSERYQKKLQYIQDNQEIFSRLKQAYLNMKYNESTSRPLVEIREKSCQTWQGVMCAACLDYAEGKRHREENDLVCVHKQRMVEVKETVQELKRLVVERARSTPALLSDEREHKYRKDITSLFRENMSLRQQLSDSLAALDGARRSLQQLAVATVLSEEPRPDRGRAGVRAPPKETSLLRRIIAKLDKRIRTADRGTCDKIFRGDSATALSDREKKVVQHIASRYDAKARRTGDGGDGGGGGADTAEGDRRRGPPESTGSPSRASTPYLTPRSPSRSPPFASPRSQERGAPVPVSGPGMRARPQT